MWNAINNILNPCLISSPCVWGQVKMSDKMTDSSETNKVSGSFTSKAVDIVRLGDLKRKKRISIKYGVMLEDETKQCLLCFEKVT
ncbi:hypothetical protein RUM43_010690 [Polyplax serrata]|uniref:Uncharacterized protein n=1 Tax=Polyplax serrata TaxID=468196 RepID=A0AAN8S7D2_POLSC